VRLQTGKTNKRSHFTKGRVGLREPAGGIESKLSCLEKKGGTRVGGDLAARNQRSNNKRTLNSLHSGAPLGSGGGGYPNVGL